MSVQFIEKDGKKEFAILPVKDYEELMAIAENKADEADVLAFRASDEETFPASVVNALFRLRTDLLVVFPASFFSHLLLIANVLASYDTPFFSSMSL